MPGGRWNGEQAGPCTGQAVVHGLYAGGTIVTRDDIVFTTVMANDDVHALWPCGRQGYPDPVCGRCGGMPVPLAVETGYGFRLRQAAMMVRGARGRTRITVAVRGGRGAVQ